MTSRERFHAWAAFEPVDRLPMIEWATWWDKTIDRWHGEGLDPALTNRYDLYREFGLEIYKQDWFHAYAGGPQPKHHGASLLEGADSATAGYEALRPWLYPVTADWQIKKDRWNEWAREQGEDGTVLWFTLPGFFWFPRTLFGIENHLYAFYDEPELMHRMNRELADWCLAIIDRVCTYAVPDFMTFAEDMSYNNGPMLSEQMFNEFMLPYYRQVVPALRERGIRVFIDSDGDVTQSLPWFERAGIEGVLPLERQAGVDLQACRRSHPRMLFIGHFDKMTMPLGEEAMREEFARLEPLARTGGFIPSVDHQTPPGVSLEQYRIYLRLLREFCSIALAGEKDC